MMRLVVNAPPRKGSSHITVRVSGIVFQEVMSAATGPAPAPARKTDAASGMTT